MTVEIGAEKGSSWETRFLRCQTLPEFGWQVRHQKAMSERFCYLLYTRRPALNHVWKRSQGTYGVNQARTRRNTHSQVGTWSTCTCMQAGVLVAQRLSQSESSASWGGSKSGPSCDTRTSVMNWGTYLEDRHQIYLSASPGPEPRTADGHYKSKNAWMKSKLFGCMTVLCDRLAWGRWATANLISEN